MALSDLAKAAQRKEKQTEERERLFRRRTGFQQFLRNFTPLLVAGIRRGAAVGKTMGTQEFASDVVASRSIATRIFAAANGIAPEKVSLQDAKMVRGEVVDLIAQLRERGLPVDEDKIVATLLEAMNLAEPAFDGDDKIWKNITAKGSASMTASHAAMEVWMVTSQYDFRVGHAEAMRRCMTAIAEMTSETVARMLGPEATPEDRRSLAQSSMRDMGRLFCARYEHAARETIETALKLPTEAQQAYFDNERPFETMIDGFLHEARDYLDGAEFAVDRLVGASDRDQGDFVYGSGRG